jgi:hypothetical protein
MIHECASVYLITLKIEKLGSLGQTTNISVATRSLIRNRISANIAPSKLQFPVLHIQSMFENRKAGLTADNCFKLKPTYGL